MSARSTLYKVYEGMRRGIAPRLRYSQELYEEALREQLHPGTRWLDLGCGHQVLPAWRLEEERSLVAACDDIVGLDYELDALRAHRTLTQRVRGDITALPFGDAKFDLVSANMVVEHLAEPEAQFREIRRVLAPGGVFLFHTPSVYGYPTALARLFPDVLKRGVAFLLDGRSGEDVFPTHYRSNSVTAIERHAAAAGLEPLRTRRIVSTAMTAMVPPLAFVELLWLRALMTSPLRGLRTNLIVALRKPA